jgi:serine/threonine-protein kinase
MSQRPPRNIEAGAVIAERYRLEAPIGRGAMGSVWRAVHVRLDAPVAIKLLNTSIAGEPVMVERFMREARAAAAVRSSHVVKIFDYGMDGGAPYIAMELLVGETLEARLEACGCLAPPELDRIFGEIARAVGVAHELGVVHRDLKPANIFLAREGEHEVTKVLDFGIAKLTDRRLEAPAARATDTGILLGTPHYMSPEQARGHRQVDHRTDLWALAVLAFECLTGRHPFESDTLGDLVVRICTGAPPLLSAVAGLPPELDRWFLRGVSKEPQERFGSAAEMASELHAVLAAEKLGAVSRPHSEPAQRRLELIGTEVIPGTTARGASTSRPSEAPSAEAGPSLNATAVAAEVLPRSRPARRRQLAVAALALSAPVLALVLTVSRRPSPPPPARAGGAARVDVAEPAGNGIAAAEARHIQGQGDAPRELATGSHGAARSALGAGGTGSAAARLDTPRAGGVAGSAGAPGGSVERNDSAPARAGHGEHPSVAAALPGPASAPRPSSSAAPPTPRRSPQRIAQTDAERVVARPASAPARPADVEVSPAPASVPASAADPYADRL